jgi:hypothetical protein
MPSRGRAVGPGLRRATAGNERHGSRMVSGRGRVRLAQEGLAPGRELLMVHGRGCGSCWGDHGGGDCGGGGGRSVCWSRLGCGGVCIGGWGAGSVGCSG